MAEHKTEKKKTLATYFDGKWSDSFYLSVFYGSLHRPEYKQIFSLNKHRCWHRSDLMSRSEMEPLLFVFDPGKMRMIKKGVYTEADTNQEMHLHL